MLSVVQVVAFLIAFVAQFSRVFVATRPFWSKLPAAVQVLLPPLVPALAALGQGLAGVKSWTDLIVVFVGCAALVLPGLPSNRSAAPMQASKPVASKPSQGDVKVALKLSVPPLVGLMIGCLLALGACSLFGSKSPLWPDEAKCLPSADSLLREVADILLAGGDYETALAHLAEKDTGAAVVCAVSTLVNDWGSGKLGADEPHLAGSARGKAFLLKAKTKVDQ